MAAARPPAPGSGGGAVGRVPPFVPSTPARSGRGAAGRRRARGPRLFLCLFWWFRPPLPTPGGRLRAQEPSRGRGVCTRVLGWKGEAEPARRQLGPAPRRFGAGWGRGAALPCPAGPRCPPAEPSAFGCCGDTAARESACALCCTPLLVKPAVNTCTVCRALAFCFIGSYCCFGVRPGAL